MNTHIRKISDLVFDFDTYLHKDGEVLQKVMKFIASGTPCPPIDVDANMRVIGGHEQWVAAMNSKKEYVTVKVHEHIKSDTDALMFACSQYAEKLSKNERNTAVYLILSTVDDKDERIAIKNTLCEILGMTRHEINKASLRREKTRDKHYDDIVELFLNNRTIKEIAHNLGIPPKQVKQTLSSAGLYVIQDKPKKTEATPAPEQLCFDDFIGESLDNAISLNQIDVQSLIDEIEGTTASLNAEYQKYGITLNNFETNRKSVQRSVNKLCRSMLALMDQLQSTIPVLQDSKLVQSLIDDIQPLEKIMQKFSDTVTDYKGCKNNEISPLKRQLMNRIIRAC
jgi:archaellum component FlaC